jgi:hypothetical protein
MLLRMYSLSSSVYSGDRHVNPRHDIDIDHPNLVLFGSSTAEELYGALRTDMITDGLLPRILMFETPTPRPKARSKVSLETPEELVELVKEWMTAMQVESFGSDPEFVFKYSAAANEIWSAKVVEYTTKMDDLVQEGVIAGHLWSRAGENMCKLALISAAANGHKEITEEVGHDLGMRAGGAPDRADNRNDCRAYFRK